MSITILNETNFKIAAKNLNKELVLINGGVKLSHGAALNLLSRSLGYADFNTIKPSLLNDSNTQSLETANSKELRKIWNLLAVKGLEDSHKDWIFEWIKSASYRNFQRYFTDYLLEDESDIKDESDFLLLLLDFIISRYLSVFSLFLEEGRFLDGVYSCPNEAIEPLRKNLKKHNYMGALRTLFGIDGKYFYINDVAEIVQAIEKSDIYFTSQMEFSPTDQAIIALIGGMSKNIENGVINIKDFNKNSTVQLDGAFMKKLRGFEIILRVANEPNVTILIKAFAILSKLSIGKYQIFLGEVMSEMLKGRK